MPSEVIFMEHDPRFDELNVHRVFVVHGVDDGGTFKPHVPERRKMNRDQRHAEQRTNPTGALEPRQIIDN